MKNCFVPNRVADAALTRDQSEELNNAIGLPALVRSPDHFVRAFNPENLTEVLNGLLPHQIEDVAAIFRRATPVTFDEVLQNLQQFHELTRYQLLELQNYVQLQADRFPFDFERLARHIRNAPNLNLVHEERHTSSIGELFTR